MDRKTQADYGTPLAAVALMLGYRIFKEKVSKGDWEEGRHRFATKIAEAMGEYFEDWKRCVRLDTAIMWDARDSIRKFYDLEHLKEWEILDIKYADSGIYQACKEIADMVYARGKGKSTLESVVHLLFEALPAIAKDDTATTYEEKLTSLKRANFRLFPENRTKKPVKPEPVVLESSLDFTLQQVKVVSLNIRRTYFSDVEAIEDPMGRSQSHMTWMLDKLIGDDINVTKANRWLGYIQAWLVLHYHCELDSVKSMISSVKDNDLVRNNVA